MTHVFTPAAAFAKLDRARQHRVELDAFIEHFFHEPANRPPVSASLDPSTGYHVFRIDSVPASIAAFQNSVAVRIGDCIHNLRSSLDHLAYQLACRNTSGQPQRPNDVQFPIVNSAQKYQHEQRRRLAEVDDESKAIIETFQPFHGRAGRPDCWSGEYVHELALLQEMSNTDKHRLLSTVLVIPSRVYYAFPPGIRAVPPPIPTSVEEALQQSPFQHASDDLVPGAQVTRERLVSSEGREVPSLLPAVGFVVPVVGLQDRRERAMTLERLERYVEMILAGFRDRFA